MYWLARRLFACPLIFVAAAWPSAASAESVEVLDTILVTPSLTPLAASRSGSAVTVITAREIEQKKLPFVVDILREVPGVAVSSSGNPGSFTQVRMRGSEGNHVLVLIDGVEVNDPIGQSEFDFGQLLSGNVERIEVLRGPQSALYGADAIGGVINIITKTGTGPIGAHDRAEGGSFSTGHGSASVGVGNHIVRTDLHVEYLDTQGTNISRFGSERDGHENLTLNGKVLVTPTDDVEFGAHVRHTEATTEGDPQDFNTCFPVPGPTCGFIIDGDEKTDRRFLYSGAHFRLETFDDHWVHTLRAGHTGTDLDFYENGVRNNGSFSTRTKLSYQSDLSFATPDLAGSEHVLSVLLENERSEYKNDPSAAFFIDPAALAAARKRRHTEQNSIAAEYRLGVMDRFFASASIRHDDNDRFENALTYRVTSSIRFPETGSRLHGSYGTGIKNPDYFELFGFDPSTFVGNPNLETEKSEGFDIGLEQRFLNDRLIVDVTYFEQDLTDEIDSFVLFDPVNFIFTAENIPGVSPRKGVEVTVSARLTDNLVLNGSYTYTDAKEASGLREARRPKHMASLAANYSFHDGRGNVHVSAVYNGEQIDTNFGTGARLTLDDFFLVNAAASYAIADGVRVFARGENLLDEKYEEIFSFVKPGIAGYGGVEITF